MEGAQLQGESAVRGAGPRDVTRALTSVQSQADGVWEGMKAESDSCGASTPVPPSQEEPAKASPVSRPHRRSLAGVKI